MSKNKKFYQKIKERAEYKPEVLDAYNQMLKEKKQQEENKEFFLIEKPCLDKLKRDLDEEECELKNREKLKDENITFLKRQMENDQLKKDLLAYQMQKEEYEEL